jgi:exosortase/archaeosortase family protein
MKEKLHTLSQLLNSRQIRPLIDVALFSVITITFHYLWWHFLGFFRATDIYLNIAGWLSTQVYHASFWFNTTLLGMNINPVHETNTLLFPDVNGYITVNESCSGFKQMYQILFLFILFRGPWKHKIWYIPAAIITMFFVNILRIILLSVVILHWTAHWDFFHEWIMRPFYYLVIFIQWVIWVEYFTKKTTCANEAKGRA